MSIKKTIYKVRKSLKNAVDVDFQKRKTLLKLGTRLYSNSGGKVFGGIFAAMKLPAIDAVLKRPNIIVGSYESDIQNALLEAILWEPDSIINIGSAEGYFAVGLAMLSHDTIPVYAFEMEERHWYDCAEMAKINQIHSIVQKGECSIRSLNETPIQKPFVFIDCEGGEMELLNPVKASVLKNAFIICELHDFVIPKITGELISRFKNSHSIQIIYESAKQVKDYRILDCLEGEKDRNLAITEFRQMNSIPDQGRWMVLTPKF